MNKFSLTKHRNIIENKEVIGNNDKIKNLIKEYDKYVENLLDSNKENIKIKNSYLIIVMSIITSFAPFIFKNISLIIKLIYMIPLLSVSIYNFIVVLKLKKSEFKNEELLYKHINVNFTMITLFILVGSFLFQSVLFPKMDIKIQLIILAIIFIYVGVCYIINIRQAPKKFLKQFMYRSNNYKKDKSFGEWAINITKILIIAVNIFKPYRLLLVLSYVLFITLVQIGLYNSYVYSQYNVIKNAKNIN